MVVSAAVNWVIISVEVLIGFLSAIIFFKEFFPFLTPLRYKYEFNEEYSLKIRKSFTSIFIQLFMFLGNTILMLLLIIISFKISQQPVPIFESILQPIFQQFPSSSLLISIGIIVLLIPKRLLVIFLPPYWVKQIKYFVLLTLVFLPLFMLNASTVLLNELFHFLQPDSLSWLSILFPTQLLAANGIVLTLVERQQLFLLIFVLMPLSITFFYQILSMIIGSSNPFGVYEWLENTWQQIDDKVYPDDNDTAVLFIHGLGDKKETWSSYSNIGGTERIVDYIYRKTDRRYLNTKIFALEFSAKLNHSLSTQFVIQQDSLFSTDNPVSMNHYQWELLFAILLLKDVKEIEQIHLISHSIGGIPVRNLLNEIYKVPEMDKIHERIGYDKDQDTIEVIDKISWLAVPHFGAKGRAFAVLSIWHSFPFKYLLRILSLIPFIETIFNIIGRIMIFFGLDIQPTYELNPQSNFVAKLNDPSGFVPLYGTHEYKNAYSSKDKIIGKVGMIGNAYKKHNPSIEFSEQQFDVSHTSPPWEQLEEKPENKVHEFPPIHQTLSVIDWIME